MTYPIHLAYTVATVILITQPLEQQVASGIDTFGRALWTRPIIMVVIGQYPV